MQASGYADVDGSSPTRCVSLRSIPRPVFDKLVAVAMVRSIAVKHLPRSRKMPTYLSELRAESRTARINFRAEDSTNQLLRLLMLG